MSPAADRDGALGTEWTSAQILALAPDDSSAKSGRDLANPRKWVTMGVDEGALWGECQGSGKNPYQTQIDLSGPAFKCSCPSRKFPCKHGLGLFLMLPDNRAAFTQTERPAWVNEWLDSRVQREEKRAQQAEARAEREAAGEPLVDAEQQAKRAAERERKVDAGMAELQRWLGDLVRGGLAEARSRPYSFWEATAARMVDAQAPGVAGVIRRMSGAPASGDGWPGRLLDHAARLHLLAEGYSRIDSLPPETAATIRSRIGWTIKEEDVVTGPAIVDEWLVMGQSTEQEERVRVRRTWLRGAATGRDALILEFSVQQQPFPAAHVVGSSFRGELAFYPGLGQLRAAIKSRQPSEPSGSFLGEPSLAAAGERWSQALAADPWTELFPMSLAAVMPAISGGAPIAIDTEGKAVPLRCGEREAWRLVAMSGGRPLGLFGEWNGEELRPLSAWDGRLVTLGGAQDA